MRREYYRLPSAAMDREMELVVFGSAGARVLVFPTRDGRFWEYETLGLTEVLRPSIEAGHFQLFCLDGVAFETLYNQDIPPDQRLASHDQHEHYLIRELLPFSESLNPNPFVVTHGCSLGAYYAVNLALRHPSRIHKAVGISGRYDLTWAVAHYRDLFDGYRSLGTYLHSPPQFLPNLTDESILQHIRNQEYVLVVGHEDPVADSNRALHEILLSKGVRSRFDLWEGEAHRARAWRVIVPQYL